MFNWWELSWIVHSHQLYPIVAFPLKCHQGAGDAQVDLNKMHQKNTKTGTKREIQMCPIWAASMPVAFWADIASCTRCWPATSAAEHSESLANGCRRYIQLIISRKFATCLAKQLPLNKVDPKWSKVYQLAELWPALADQRRGLLLFSIILRVATYQTYLNDLKDL
jgi:hypothetical protein